MTTFDPYSICYIAKLECGHSRRTDIMSKAGTFLPCMSCPEIEKPQGKEGKLPFRRVIKLWHQSESEPSKVQEDGLLEDIRETYFEPGRDYRFEVSKTVKHFGLLVTTYEYWCHVSQDFPSWMIVATESFSSRAQAERWGKEYLARRGPDKDFWMVQQALREGRLEMDGTPYTYQAP